MTCSSQSLTSPRFSQDAIASASGAAALLRRCGALLGEWIERARQRWALGELDERLLDDIGIPPEAARRESAMPFWRTSVPCSARRRAGWLSLSDLSHPPSF